MILQKSKILAQYLYILDIFFIILAFFVAYLTGRILDPLFLGHGLYRINDYLWLIFPVAVIWYILLYLFGMHSNISNIGIKKEAVKSFELTAIAIILIYGMLFMFKITYISRLFIGYFAVYGFSFLIVSNYIGRNLARRFKRRGYSYRTILIVSDDGNSGRIEKTIKANEYLGLKIAGIMEKNGIADVPDFVLKNPVDEVIFDINGEDINKIKDLTLLLEEEGITVKILTDIIPFKYSKIAFERVGDLPMLSFYTAPEDEVLLVVKRFMDIIGATIGIVIFSIPALIIAILIKASTKEPVLYKSKRVGLHGRLFTFYKFTTMVESSNALREELMKKYSSSGIELRIKDDPRLTFIGKILRRASLNEIPQFYNVLRGDMSLVGPRPPMPDEVAKYTLSQRRRLSMKPGITCLWQVSGRNELSFEDKVALDLKYIDNWSLKLDFIILLKTIPAVVFAKGAM